MRKTIFVIVVLLALGSAVMAEPKAELFGGYQYTRVNPGSGISGENFNGWNAALTGFVNNRLGITGDFSGAYKTISGESIKFHTFMGGPTLAPAHGQKFSPFVHALFGVVHGSTVGFSENSFGMALGGGVDVGTGRGHLAIRLVQADYLMSRFNSSTQNNARISAGVVIRF